MSYPIVYEVRPDGVFLVCREIPGLEGVIAELRVPDELVTAWAHERPAFCPRCGARLVHVGEGDDGEPLEQWCRECDGTFWG